MIQSKASVRDKLSYFSNGAGLRQPMVAVINANQDLQPHVQILACALALEAMCDGINHDAHAVINQIRRAKTDARSPFSQQYDAMVEYSKQELS